MKLWFILLFIIKVCNSEPIPVVMWHGMGDTCCAPYSLASFKKFIEQHVPGIYVSSLMFGNNTIEDLESGYFMNPNKQVAYACRRIFKNPKLANGFTGIGFSQGSQFLRAVVQRCGHKLPPMKYLITLGGQHQGVYGIPQCGALQHKSCDYVRELINHAAYNRWVQESLVQATYWHDPLNEEVYRNYSIFLSDINNEVKINRTYVENLNKLEKFVMVKFNNDTIVDPRESSWFGFYAPGQAKKTIPLQDSRIYIQDRLGLKRMDKAGKLDFIATNGNHLKMSEEWILKRIIKPYLYSKN